MMFSNYKFINLFNLLFLLSLGSSFGCQRKDPGSGGTVVGNGFIRYHDKTYNYYFDYTRDLKLTQLNELTIKVDNHDYAQRLGLRASELIFVVKEAKEVGESAALEYARKLGSEFNWNNIVTTQTKGVYSKSFELGILRARYIFQLSGGYLLDVTATAVPEAHGIKYVSDVLASVNSDTQPPVIHELFYEPSTVTAGQTVKLKIRATDNMTKIRGTSPSGSVAIRTEQKCRMLATVQWKTVETCGEFRALGDDWYEFDVPTNSRMKSGEYFVTPLTIWDEAGNSTELLPDSMGMVHRSTHVNDQALIPLAQLTIINPNADVSSPQLNSARFEPAEVIAGMPSKLVFEATDNEPNFVPTKFCERALHKDWFRFQRTDIPKNAEVDPTEYSVHACKTPKKRTDGLWEIDVKTEKGLPPGEYVMDFPVRDSVGNSSKLVTTKLLIKNDEMIDVEGPKIIQIKTDRSLYKPGEKGSILIQATDNFSGVSGESTYLARNFCRQRLVASQLTDDDTRQNNRILICDGTLRKIRDDWYELGFYLPDQVPIGEYYLPEISLVDNVGNRTFLDSVIDANSQGVYRDKHNDRKTNLPIIRVNVTK